MDTSYITGRYLREEHFGFVDAVAGTFGFPGVVVFFSHGATC
jgi:hypothetical protein